MDLGVYMRVLWRFKFLVAIGLTLGLLLAVLSTVRIDVHGAKIDFSYRGDEVWRSSATVFVTQEGFPSGRAILDEMIRVEAEGAPPSFVPRYSEDGRYSGLAEIYAELAKSDAVRRAVLAGSPPGANYQPDPVTASSGSVLPLMYMTGYGKSPEVAVAIANRATTAFRDYLAEEQARNGISDEKRVEVVVIRRANGAELFKARSFVRPIFAFLLITMVSVAMAFVLENIRPRVRPAPDVLPAEHPARARRSA